MDVKARGCSADVQSEEEMDLRRGPWTVEEDFKLINYIATHGEGRWNSLARCAGIIVLIFTIYLSIFIFVFGVVGGGDREHVARRGCHSTTS